jgi:hypothetical protein
MMRETEETPKMRTRAKRAESGHASAARTAMASLKVKLLMRQQLISRWDTVQGFNKLLLISEAN